LSNWRRDDIVSRIPIAEDRSMDLQDLVQEDAGAGTFRIHRSTMTSAEILRLEQERIFDRCWLYVGHDSEVAKNGDFIRRTIAGRPLFMVRGLDGVVRTFMNSCIHRGAQICRQDQGNAGGFVCFYHGWSFNDRGELIAVPDPEGYPEGFCESGRRLLSPPHVDSYRGLHFVNFAAEAISLVDYLGSARELIDQTMDAAELVGGWQIIRGSAKYDIRANWKLLLENSVDNYHFQTVHKTFADYMAGERKRANLPRLAGNPFADSRGVTYENGHVAMLTTAAGRSLANPSPTWTPEAIAEANRLREQMIATHGEERGTAMANRSRFLLVFPNLMFHDTQSGMKLRQFWPTAPDRMQVTQWELVPRRESKELAYYRLQGGVTFQGPGGFGTPDDVEALESCQIGYGCHEVEWSDASRGMRRDSRSDDELTARGFWRHWHALILGGTGTDRMGDPPVPQKVVAMQRAAR
jgi:p-cumate 2,3-dioxygenase subunit alpha